MIVLGRFAFEPLNPDIPSTSVLVAHGVTTPIISGTVASHHVRVSVQANLTSFRAYL